MVLGWASTGAELPMKFQKQEDFVSYVLEVGEICGCQNKQEENHGDLSALEGEFPQNGGMTRMFCSNEEHQPTNPLRFEWSYT